MKATKGQKIFNIINCVFMLLLCIIMIYPYLNQLAIAFNESLDTAVGGVTIWPRKFTFNNFATVFKNEQIYSSAIVSITRTIIGTVLALVITFSAAYALTRKNLKGRKFFTWYLCIPMYFTAGVIPTYMLYRYLGLMNNYLVYILPMLFSFYNMVIIRSFLQELPAALEESAMLDGANEFVIMFKIIFPLALPVIATVALWVAVGHWNDWTSTLYYVTKDDLYTMQYVMMQIIKQSDVVQQMVSENAMMGMDTALSVSSESVQAAVLITATLPILLAYPFLQKYFIQGVTLGAVKE